MSKNKNDFFFHICCKALIVKLYFIFATEGSDIFESFRCWQASPQRLAAGGVVGGRESIPQGCFHARQAQRQLQPCLKAGLPTGFLLKISCG
ncbi:MAG: hypothetical protein MJZ86_04735 [Bacteroidales bacterium]|nr:hypothetical protein [Bacteroidales bacterium]